MDFFEAQELARKRTKLLVLYFMLAILGIVLAVYVLLVGVLYVASGGSETPQAALQLWQPNLLLVAAVGSLVVILVGSGYKVLQLASGGERVARELGGRRVSTDTTDPDERRLLNVVEEMAIASGTPVPDVYVLEDEEGINAFAAGYSSSDAVIGVTRGCMQLLTRSELQGVIAHEFSHILNGDMRLNIRLMGLLFGIVMMTVLGRILLRSGAHGSSSRKNNGAAAILLFGAGLLVIGSIGAFFARLIQAAVSRQREYLADASAVQFTRLPEGIAGALKKIGGLSQGSRLLDPHAEEASHMFFADGLVRHLGSALATHPPLEARIRALEPHWDGKFVLPEGPDERRRAPAGRPVPRSAAVAGFASAGSSAARIDSPGAPSTTSSEGATGGGLPAFREPSDAQIAHAAALQAALPRPWLERARHASGAQAGIFGLLLSSDPALREEQLGGLAQSFRESFLDAVHVAYEETKSLTSEQKLALIDLAIPALRRLSPAEYDHFAACLKELVQADGRVTLFEFALEKILERHLDLYFRRRAPTEVRYARLAEVADSIGVLLSALAWVGSRGDTRSAEQAFRAGLDRLAQRERGLRLSLRGPGECGLGAVGRALDLLDGAGPLLKKAILEACGAVVLADGQLLGQEAELIRAIADSLGAPLPVRAPTSALVGRTAQV